MIASLFLSLSVAALQPGTHDRRPPVDTCAVDAGFAAFRTALNDAIARRDEAFILSILPNDILVNFGGERGREAFAREWRLGEADSPFWSELRTVLALGCMRDGNEFVAPSWFSQLGDDEDPFELVLAVRSGAALRARPDPAAEQVATLDWDVLRMLPGDDHEAWLAVRMADGREGFVARADVRSPIDYRAFFARDDGRWRMFLFIAGD